MCNYKTLAHNENDYIILCNSCKNYQLAFGTTLVSFLPKDYAFFKKQLKYFSDDDKYKTFKKQKSISLDLFCSSSIMALNYAEFTQLNDLIGLAAFNENIETIFEDINIRLE